MALEKYKEKRKFDKTPEPEGLASDKKENNTLSFVVQKHEATRLHYDFRIEMNGVMPSWAVPKGPSLNPEDKRLAMKTEDHPLDYQTFEGIIPKGNYGAGSVMVWDRGNYAPEGVTTTDVKEWNKLLNKMMEEGEIKIVLNGDKLKGSFALVKMKNGDEDNAWLLIKHKDEFATDEDITKKDHSVKTGRSMEEIVENKKPDLWISNRDIDLSDAPKKTMPKEVKPMLATLVKDPFDDPNFIFEIKWDGYRVITTLADKKAALVSRNNISFDELFKPIKASLEDLNYDAIFDGEAVILDKTGRSDFQLLQNYKKTREGNLVYYIFDILHYQGHDLTDLPLYRRQEILRQVIPQMENVRVSDFVQESGKEFFEVVKKQGIEGIVAKKKDSTYRMGIRSDEWLKIKTHMRQEAVVGGFTEPRGGRKEMGALILGVYDGNGDLIYIGHTGGGFDDRSLHDSYKKLKPLTTSKSHFKDSFKTNAPATWVKPNLVCEVEFSGWTQDGHMRQPIFVGFREDKDPQDVRREVEQNTAAEVEKTETKIGGIKKQKGLEFSNLDKIYFPQDSITKGDLIKYYERISEYMLPYLKDRPESLRRNPNGITGDEFWQKNVENFPSWVETIKVESEHEERTINYCMAQDKESLLYLVNLGCIEINPWFSRKGHLENPDFFVMDLDPEDISFEYVIKAANVVREVFETLDIESYPKTSGATGIHIYVPLGAKYDYEQVRVFAEIIARTTQSKAPDFLSVERSPSKRQKKVYVDFLQNRVGQTLAAPYSARPKKGATVSTPLRWNEVKKGLTPQDFNIQNIFERLEKVGDLWKPVMGKGIDMEKALKNLN